MSGTRSRPFVRSAQLFRSSPCSSSLRYVLTGSVLPGLGCWRVAVWYSGSGVLQLRFEWACVNTRAFSTGLHASIQYDAALRAGVHIVALYWTFAGTPAVLKTGSRYFKVNYCVNGKILPKELFILSLQVIYFTLHERFVKNQIHQFVDVCSISNVSRKCKFIVTTLGLWVSDMWMLSFLFTDFSAAVLPSLLWLLHPWTFSPRPRRYKHGGNEQQPEKRSRVYSSSGHSFVALLWHVCCGFFNVIFCLKESMCGQRGLLPNTDVQTFQVSFTRHLRMQYERIRDLSNRVCPVCWAWSSYSMKVCSVSFIVVLSRELGHCGWGIQAQLPSLSRTPVFTTPWTTSWDHS